MRDAITVASDDDLIVSCVRLVESGRLSGNEARVLVRKDAARRSMESGMRFVPNFGGRRRPTPSDIAESELNLALGRARLA